MGQISPELEKRLSLAVEKMPAFPKSVQRILELTRDINCLPKDVVGVIEKDPVITIKILKIINSAYYRLPNKITSINQSVVYLGINTIKNLALNFSTIGILPSQNPAGFDIHDYLMHSLATATIARQVGLQYADGEADPNDCYIAGLLHDFGKVVFAQYMPEEFREALDQSAFENMPLHQAEEIAIGADHTLVGAMLARRWQFPETLIECISEHHSGSFCSPLAECLYVADQITDRLGYDSHGNLAAEMEPPALPARFGGDLDTVMAALGDLDKMVEEAKSFSQMGAS